MITRTRAGAPAHPGAISYIDGDTGAVLRSESIASVPASLRFADTPEGPVPVVKVVATRAGGQRTVREYGPGDRLLRSTVAFF